MKTGDLVRYWSGTSFSEPEKFGIFLDYGNKMEDPNDFRRKGILIDSTGKLIETIHFLKINYETR